MPDEQPNQHETKLQQLTEENKQRLVLLFYTEVVGNGLVDEALVKKAKQTLQILQEAFGNTLDLNAYPETDVKDNLRYLGVKQFFINCFKIEKNEIKFEADVGQQTALLEFIERLQKQDEAFTKTAQDQRQSFVVQASALNKNTLYNAWLLDIEINNALGILLDLNEKKVPDTNIYVALATELNIERIEKEFKEIMGKTHGDQHCVYMPINRNSNHWGYVKFEIDTKNPNNNAITYVDPSVGNDIDKATINSIFTKVAEDIGLGQATTVQSEFRNVQRDGHSCGDHTEQLILEDIGMERVPAAKKDAVKSIIEDLNIESVRQKVTCALLTGKGIALPDFLKSPVFQQQQSTTQPPTQPTSPASRQLSSAWLQGFFKSSNVEYDESRKNAFERANAIMDKHVGNVDNETFNDYFGKMSDAVKNGDDKEISKLEQELSKKTESEKSEAPKPK